MTKYRRLFCRGLEHHNKQGRLAKASAWYIVSFPKSGQRFPNRPFLSFGWVMEGVLCEIKHCQKFEEIGNSKPLEREVGDSILSYFTNDQAPGTFLSERDSFVTTVTIHNQTPKYWILQNTVGIWIANIQTANLSEYSRGLKTELVLYSDGRYCSVCCPDFSFSELF